MSETLFQNTFGYEPNLSTFTPGRVNLIGEHVDYNGGQVLPTALSLGIDLAIHPREDGRVRIRSDAFSDMANRDLSAAARKDWSDYVLGALQLAYAQGFGPHGADVAVTSTLPFGAGLSSSAAVTVGTLRAASELTGITQSPTRIAKLAQSVENTFIGVPCGIMDQMAVAHAQPGTALSLDTLTLDHDRIALPDTHHMAVIHSGVRRQLNAGGYKARKEDCDAVRAAAGKDAICRLSDSELDALRDLPDTLFRRARHCVTEHRRTLAAADALRTGDMKHFGNLMNASHASLRDDFEVSVPEVDALVADAQRLGAVGARMTGGGFGGCIVACVERDRVGGWREALLSAHPNAVWVA